MSLTLLRSANHQDLEAISELTKQSGIGLTTLPKEAGILQERLNWSSTSFHQLVHTPEREYYLFVLEDLTTGSIVGTSAIEAYIGHDTPFYSYKLSKRTRICHSLNIRSEYEVLNLVNDKQGCSELCTLFLMPDYRHNSNGLLLSRARFLFIAHYQNRFASTIIADMRGMSTNAGESPFWNAIGQHFFHMSFSKADELTISTNKQFIADLMPRHPVYVKLLSAEAQAVIGKPHQSTLPAMKILMREGFRYNQYIDIFDAGPTIEAPTEQIQSISSSQILVVKNIIDEVSSKRFIVANTRLDFRAIICQIIVNEIQQTCILSKESAECLQIQCGDCVRIVPLHYE